MNSKEFSLEHLSDHAPLPEILTAEWAADQVMQLFDDLRDGAEVVHVQLRTSDTDASVRLSDAKAAFAKGAAQAIQIRYRFEREMWCDTIRPGNPTTQIIRNRLPMV
jgi:hypothetical protein